MIEARFLAALHKIHPHLTTCRAPWVITGSFGMALQGMEIEVHDIDLQTNTEGAYEIESKLREYVLKPVRYLESERMRSHLGALEIEGIRVEIMGSLQKRLDEGIWEEPVPVERFRQWLEVEGMQIPVLSLEYEYQAYLKLGRFERAQRINEWLKGQCKDSEGKDTSMPLTKTE